MISIVRLGFLSVLLGVLAGCGQQWSTNFDQVISPDISRHWRVSSVNVVVPETLTVSDANNLAPEADIVWHGDPAGDRRTQVAAIIEAGVRRGAAGLGGSVPVHLVVVLDHFHGVTPRALRIAPSAVHNIRFTIRVFDNRSGQELTSAIVVDADLEAYVGAQAQAAKEQGITEKARIITHIAAVTAGWLGIAEDPRGEFSAMGR